MNDLRLRLQRRFRRQQEFAGGYSPLYSRLFGIVADWLATESGDPVIDWLLQVAAQRASFDVPLLLLAGLHRDVLTSVAEVADLARYYPSVGGAGSCDDPLLAPSLRQAILARRKTLAEIIQTATVQTNETARGLCWLLPIHYTRWQELHLVDLGASAGLNLVADYRHYRVASQGERNPTVDLGKAGEPQFCVNSLGEMPPLSFSVPPPAILSRIGCDLSPFALTTKHEEQSLASFVWGDQVERLQALRQGIAAYHQVNATNSPVRVYPANLPDELPKFLEQRVSCRPQAPIVVYNTYLTTYLHDKGASLRSLLASWAVRQSQPVLWLQWETLWQGVEPPAFGWVGWTADLWWQGVHRFWHLAWAHPHGTHLQWLPDGCKFADFWREAAAHPH